MCSRCATRAPTSLQAAIAALHAQAASSEETDWPKSPRSTAELERSTASPVVALNRAVAVAMTEGYERGLALMDGLPLDEYHLFHAARADCSRRLERHEEAAAAYRRALELTNSTAERAFLSRRLESLTFRLSATWSAISCAGRFSSQRSLRCR